jgi:hypothetical protein
VKGGATSTLTKWYLDCTDAGGRSAIAAWLVLSWHGLRLSAHAITLHEAGSPPTHRSSLSSTAEPEFSDGLVTWRTDALGCSVTGKAMQPPFGARLLEHEGGAVDWECMACPAHMEITTSDGTCLSGLGYAERLTLSLAPWRLPIDELRWGRWIAWDGLRSAVWIDWRGPHPLTVVFLDGAREPSATVGDDVVAMGGAALFLTGGRVLHHRALRDIVGRSDALTRVVPETWLEMQDCKWMSTGSLEASGERAATGWAIHEHVRFP